ncbi:cytochrome c oxidase subunit 2 [Stella humosa]|uniref:Cytochrome aa3 subunit 2 n=1 Tax=Stella humosa TaxID=94 RepID=A0A3N1LN09_9PROT|nr:cytochrome c oxidase subunit II [Stella humosa]ROP90595.1 cytochrome c oxidase subunit 2 [Stella humosa]
MGFGHRAVSGRAEAGRGGATGNRRLTRAARAGFLLVPAGALLGGCGGPLSALDPAGPAAAATAQLWWWMLGGATLILVGVMALLAYALAGGGRSPSTAALLGGAGIAFPLVVLTALLVFSLRTGEALLPRTGGDAPLRVEAHARQWWWEFVYPDFAGRPLHTAGELHIPAGRAIEVEVMAHDVIHSFWVPRLGGKIDAIPGHRTRIRLGPVAPGTYRGQCAEFCGLQHTFMGFQVIAHTPDAFQARLDALARPPEPARPGAAEFVAACGQCHSADARRPSSGPNLAGVAGRQWLGGGALANDGPDAFARWIAQHPVLKPGSHEPHHGLLEAAAADSIARYLGGLR